MSVVALAPYTTATGNGATTSFPFALACQNASDIVVYVNGTQQLSGVSVTLGSDNNSGTVVFTTAPANAAAIIIASQPSLEQQIQFENAGPYNPVSVDGALDAAAIRDLFLKGLIDRAPKVPLGETIGTLPAKAARAGLGFGFDANGDPIALNPGGADSALRTDLAAGTGARLVGATAPNGSPTFLSRHIVRNYVEDAGVIEGSGGNPATNATALNTALATGKVFRLKPGGLYKIGSSLIPTSNSALVCESGNRPTIYCPAANFTNTDNVTIANRYGASAVAINLSGLTSGLFTPNSGIVLENFIVQFETGIGRYLRGVVGRNITKCKLNGLEVFGIPTGIGICLASALHCDIDRPYIHDFTDSTNWGALPQLTGIEIDNDQVNSIATDDLEMRSVRIEDLTVSGALLSTWGYQTDGVNVCNKAARARLRGARIKNVGEAVDWFGSDGLISDIEGEAIYQYFLKFIHGAQRNQATNVTVNGVGLAGVLFTGSTVANQDTEGNEVKGLSVIGLDPNGVWASSDSAGVLVTDNGGTAGKPRNNQVIGATIYPGANGRYGWLDSSTGSRNMGHDIDPHDGASLQKRVFVQNGGGAVQIKTSPAYHTNLAPGTIPVPRNISLPNTFPYVPSQFEEVILVQGSGARTINLPPEWSGIIKDGLLNAGAGTITIAGVPSASGTGSIATDASGQGILTMTAVTGTIYEGTGVTGASSGTIVEEWLTGTKGGIGTYRVNKPQTLASTSLTFPAAGNIDGSASQTITSNGGHIRVDPIPGAGNGWNVTA